MGTKIRVGIAGAGFIGAVHARAYMQVPDVEIVGIADPIAEKVEPLSHATRCRAFRDYEELLKTGVDVLNVYARGSPPSVTGEDGRTGLAAVLAVHRLAETGASRPIPLPI